MKKILLSLFFSFVILYVHAQEYRINSVRYDITGNFSGTTREYPLRQAVEIDTERVFISQDELETYLADINVQFKNIRVLETSNIFTTFNAPDKDGIIPVDLLVTTVDTFNLFGLPYPKYDSNYGLELKLAINHYNFLGSMLPLDFDITYEYDTEDEASDHIFGLYTSFAIPFELGILDAEWDNELDFSYTIGNDYPEAGFETSLNMSHKFNDVISLSAGVSQGIAYEPEYKQYNDEFYLTEGANISMPVTLARTENLGNIRWTPSLNIAYYWDPTDFIIDTGNSDLIDTNITYNHAFSLGRVNWVGNFKDGATFSFSQSLIQETYKEKFNISSNIQFAYFKAFEHLGFKSRAYMYTIVNDTSELGSRVRGIQNDDIDTNNAIILNFDLPIKVWQTDWVGYGLWDWTSYLDFEMQISPFIDIAMGYNSITESTFSLEDGWYAAGIEITGYLNRAKSVVGRIMGGVDIVQILNNPIGNRIPAIKTFTNDLFDTSWRKDNWYEFSFGIGLFY